MDSVKRSAVTPRKSRLARTFTKVLRFRSVTEVISDDGFQTEKSQDKIKEDHMKNAQIPSFDLENEELQKRAVKEAFLAKFFASLSAVKAAYAQLQFAQSPYDADGIKSADQIIVLELKNLSEWKQSYLKDKLNETSPKTTLLLSEIQEHKSLLKTYEITSKKLDTQIKLKDSEISFLKERLVECNRMTKSLEKQLNSSQQFTKPERIEFSNLRPSHFSIYSRQAMKSVRSFVQLLISKMESAGWDLHSAASSIEPGVSLWKHSHKRFVFESFVCGRIFDGFNYDHFSIHPESTSLSSSSSAHQNSHNLYFDQFMVMKSVKPADYLAMKPKSMFATFCRSKYLKLIHPKMEASLFGNLDQRNMLNSGQTPETPFFSAFCEMAKRVWLLHLLALSFDPVVSIFQVKKGCRFSEVYMESLNDEAFALSDGNPDTDPRVCVSVAPGFRIGKTIVQCHVYLC